MEEREPDLTSKLPWNKLLKSWRFFWGNIACLCFDEETDFISELPDCVLIHILSFLNIHDAVKTCVLSKRWSHLWISLPRLCFSMDAFIEPLRRFKSFDWSYRAPEFPKFIDKVMSLRDRSTSTIHTFHILVDSSVEYDYGFSVEVIERWFSILGQHSVVVLDITVKCSYIVLPRSLLNCKTLETLSISNGDSMGDLTLELPNIHLPALKKLHLENFVFRSEDISDLISNSPVLETLEIENCEITTYNLVINAPNLRHLRIHLSEDYGPPEFACRKIPVFAPLLECFSCKEKQIMGDYTLNIFSIVRAEMNLLSCLYFDNLHFRNVGKALAQISKVKALYLAVSELLFQALFAPRTRFNPHIQFYNLTILSLETSVYNDQTEARSYILEICPRLETLVLHIRERPDIIYGQSEFNSVDEEFLLKKLPLECISHHLKFVDFEGTEALGLEKEFAFIKFLLQNALVLETLNFYHKYVWEKSRVSKFVKQVEKITRASPNVQISLLGWRHACF